MRALHGEQARWGDAEYLLAQIVDYLQAQIIQQSGKKRPLKPVPRPGQRDRKTYGNRSMSVEQLRRRRERRKAREGGEQPSP